MAASAAVASKQYALYDVKGEQKSSVISCPRLRTYWLPKTGINSVRSTAYIVALIVALYITVTVLVAALLRKIEQNSKQAKALQVLRVFLPRRGRGEVQLIWGTA